MHIPSVYYNLVYDCPFLHSYSSSGTIVSEENISEFQTILTATPYKVVTVNVTLKGLILIIPTVHLRL